MATEGCKSNALMRCCKDLGIAWQLWDPVFIKQFKKDHVAMVQGFLYTKHRVHWKTGIIKWLSRRKDRTLEFPYKEKTSS